MISAAASSPHGPAKTAMIRDVRIGLIGRGIQLSRTPGMHVVEGDALGLNYTYDLIDIDAPENPTEISRLLARAEKDGYRGVNVTHPFKQQVMAHLDCLSDAALNVGAVNTIVFESGKRSGHNTDFWGFKEAFRNEMADVPLSKVLLLGAGGAGSAVAHALLDLGVEQMAIHDPNCEASTALADDVNNRAKHAIAEVLDDPQSIAEKCDGVVNATPVGMANHPGTPLPKDLLHAGQWVADIIYFPLETEFLRNARELHCKAMNGSGMAIYQAVRAFELFTGLKPDPLRMKATFDAFDKPIAG